MGGAQQEHLALLGFFLKVVKVHLITAFHQTDGALHHFAAVQVHRPVEGVVNRGQEQHIVPGLGEGSDGGVQRLDHTVGLNDPVLLDVPAVAGGQPVLDGVGVPLAPPGVAPHAKLGGALQLLDDLRRGEQFHIGHGQGHHTLGGVGADGIPLGGLHAHTGVGGVELKFHC